MTEFSFGPDYDDQIRILKESIGLNSKDLSPNILNNYYYPFIVGVFNENKVYSHIPKHLIRDGLDIEKLDFLSISNILKDSFEKIPKELESLPLPFGGLGYVSYEFFSECEKFNFSKKPLYDAPTAMLVFPRECIVFDHLYDEMYLAQNLAIQECEDNP